MNRERTGVGILGLTAQKQVTYAKTAEPVSRNLTKWITDGAIRAGIPITPDITYACVEGPRLGTRAESHFYKNIGCHVLGMTNVPEVFLAREAQLCYASIGIVTDYDCWMDDPAMHVQATEIFGFYAKSLAAVKDLLAHLMQSPLPAEDEEIRTALSRAVLTPPERISPENRHILDILAR